MRAPHQRHLLVPRSGTATITDKCLAPLVCLPRQGDPLVRMEPGGVEALGVIDSLRERILLREQTSGRVPLNLEDCPPIEGKIDETRDAWGRPIVYSADAQGIVTLVSYGADGVPGGVGQDADIIGVFATDGDDAALQEWIEDPYGAFMQPGGTPR